MDKLRVALISLHCVCAAVGLAGSAVVALFFGGFSMDSPYAPAYQFYVVGGITLLAGALPLTVLPLWAAWKIKREGGGSLTASIIHSVLILTFVPIGTVAGAIQLFLVWQLRKADQMPAGQGCDAPANGL